MMLHERITVPRLPARPYHPFPSPKSIEDSLPSLPPRKSGTMPPLDTRDYTPRPPTNTWHETGSSQSENELKEKEEYTTKGRKRKRLAKACSACHKNKRRCDGFAPCTNCEFSARPCLYLNAHGETIPPPRTRDPSCAPHHRHSRDGETVLLRHVGEKRQSGESSRPGSGGQTHRDSIDAVEGDASLSAELIDIFFKRVLPYPAMFHPPTFHYRLHLNRVSTVLLDSIYALAARFCDHAMFLSTFPADTPASARGQAFADRAHLSARHMIEQRASGSNPYGENDRASWEETEFAQALYLLSVYFTCIRRTSIGQFYLDSAYGVLRHVSSGSTAHLADQSGLDEIDYLTLMESQRRTLWMVVIHDFVAVAEGRPKSVHDREIYHVSLPGGESQWARWGGSSAEGHILRRRHGIKGRDGNWPGTEGQVEELGYLIRILSIFSDIMILVNEGGSDIRSTPADLERDLKTWALGLPHNLQFDEINLTLAMSKVVSCLPAIALNGWIYAYMHAIAECGMFYLQAAVVSSGWTAQRQSQAVNNIAIILEALGERGRQSPLVMFPLTVVTNWREHLRKTLSPTSTHRISLDEERLVQWWTEIKRSWGIDIAHITDRDPHIRNPKYGVRFDHSTSSLGLHHSTSPPPTASKDFIAMSPTSSTTTLPTPNSYNARGHCRLPPLRSRPRTSSTSLIYPASPALDIEWTSPPRPNGYQDHRRLPSLPALSGNEARDRKYARDLPPPGGFEVLPTSMFVNERRNMSVASRREGSRESKRERVREGKTERQRERDEDRYHPYTGHRPSSPLGLHHSLEQVSNSWEQVTDIEEKQKPRIVGHGLLGIAALVSAAEEKVREEEVNVRA